MADGERLPALLAAGWLLLIALSGSALAEISLPEEAEDGPHAETPVLHLRADHPGGGSYRNFTTEAPAGSDPLPVDPCRVATDGVAEWCWQMHRSPEPWTLRAGAKAEAILHLGALDRVPLGLVDPESPEKSGKLRIDVILTRGTSDEVAQGTTWIDAPVLAGDDQAAIRVPLEVPQDASWNTEPGDAPAVELQVQLSGLVRRDEPPLVLTASNTSDSRLLLPGFPLKAFRQWEQDEDEDDGCREKILAQEPCGPEAMTDGQNDGPIEEAPAAGVAGWVALLLGALVLRARSRSRRRTRS